MDNTSQLTVNDIATVRSMLDLACKRGTFGGDEVKSVGIIYEKLSGFLSALEEQQTENTLSADKPTHQTQGE